MIINYTDERGSGRQDKGQTILDLGYFSTRGYANDFPAGRCANAQYKFWIDPDHKGQTILDLGYFDFAQYKFWILD